MNKKQKVLATLVALGVSGTGVYLSAPKPKPQKARAHINVEYERLLKAKRDAYDKRHQR